MHLSSLVNCVHFGPFWVTGFLPILVSFDKYGLLVNLVHTIHLINVVLTILDKFTLQKKKNLQKLKL